ncbi:MAG: hypothetical protein ACR2FY_18820 [Pirellulaceae bacterium]
MNVELLLRYSPAAVRPARAWLIPGVGPAEWLAELTTWGVPLTGMRLFVVAREGALVLPGKGSAEVSPRLTAALPYGCAGSRLYLPVEAWLEPPLSDAELRELLAEDAIYVWHPVQGLARFAWEQAAPVSELLAVPPLGARIWDAAEPGIAENMRLLSIAPASPISLEDVLEAGRDDIGRNPLAEGKLPPAPGEPQGGAIGRALKSAGLGALSGGAGLLAKAANALHGLGQGIGGGVGSAAPASAGGKNWLQRLADWAREQQQAINKDIDQLRNNQIERLLNLLQNSPDAGLAFALPLTGGADYRGLAPPGSQLTPRDVNFNLRRLGGGGPADFWNLSFDYQQALRQKYRELANREISLGRHRRAAYILAELIGDISAAAATLRDGEHFREAAVLFEKKLNQPLAAAQCLQRGGLLAEAIVIYERLEAWETVAEIYDQLQQSEQAAVSWRKAVSKHLTAGDRLGAAQLLEEKLRQAEEAYEILWSSWPAKSQAKVCLDASFDLLARIGEHERAGQQVRQLRARVQTSAQLGDLSQSLARLANNYPLEQVRFAAADLTRRIAADSLPGNDDLLAHVLLKSLADLVPGDRLLSRDCIRYRSQHAEHHRRSAIANIVALAGSKGPRLVQTIQLPHANWKAAVSIGNEYYAAGVAEGKILLIRGRWDGGIQHPVGKPWPVTPQQADGKFLLAADPRGVSKLLLHVAANLPQGYLKFPVGSGFPDPLTAGSHPQAGVGTIGLGYSLGGTTLALSTDGPFKGTILQFDANGALLGSRDYAVPLDDMDYLASQTEDRHWEPVYLERAGWHYLGLNRNVAVLGPQDGVVNLHSPVLSLTASPPHTRARIVFACEEGGMVLWGESAEGTQTIFARDLMSPVVGLNRGGYLVAATAERVQVYRTTNTPLPYLGEAAGPGTEPIAILAHEQIDQFAILSADGRVSYYEVKVPK